jgi:hypothetical protein
LAVGFELWVAKFGNKASNGSFAFLGFEFSHIDSMNEAKGMG